MNTDRRTAEQIAADGKLTAAVEAASSAYGDDHRPYVLGEYVIVAAHHGVDEDGEPITAVSIINRESGVPAHRQLGLLDYAITRLRRYVAED